jgi:putative transposase
MIDRGHKLPLIRQAAVRGLRRGSLYYHPCTVPAAEWAIMRRIDELPLDYPFAGSRMRRDLFVRRGHRDRAGPGCVDDAAEGP